MAQNFTFGCTHWKCVYLDSANQCNTGVVLRDICMYGNRIRIDWSWDRMFVFSFSDVFSVQPHFWPQQSQEICAFWAQAGTNRSPCNWCWSLLAPKWPLAHVSSGKRSGVSRPLVFILIPVSDRCPYNVTLWASVGCFWYDPVSKHCKTDVHFTLPQADIT